jgi:hypothetical protein
MIANIFPITIIVAFTMQDFGLLELNLISKDMFARMYICILQIITLLMSQTH